MIVNKDGRLRSVRTADEIEALLKEDIEGLEPSEREVLDLILKELRGEVEPPDGKPLIQVLSEAEYIRPPVDMRTFVTDPYYLGESCQTLYPKLLDHLVEMFEGDYEEIILGGAIGTGKTFTSSIGISRILYEISCLKDPHASYGIAKGSTIDIVCVSVKAELAQKVAFENIATKIKSSPYFQEHFPFEPTKKEILFPNNVRIQPLATTETSALGMNVHTAFIDEADFMPTRRNVVGEQENRSDSIHATILTRMQSRFGRKGKLPGKLFVASSKTTNDGFTSKRLTESMYNPKIYAIDYCLTADTRIPLLDGTTHTIRELAEGAAGPEFWVYSLDKATHRVVPGRVTKAWLARTQAQTYRVTLDNGEVIRATGNHPFMLRDGTYRRVDELRPEDSLMPLYRKLNRKGYEQVAHPGEQGKWQTTHRASIDSTMAPWPYRGADGYINVVHHKNCNKRDNRPENLQWMGLVEHQAWHRDSMTGLTAHVKCQEHRDWAAKRMAALHAAPEFAAKRDARSRKTMAKLQEDPEFRNKQVASVRGILTAYHQSEKGKKAQTTRNYNRWDEQGRKTDIAKIQQAAADGVSISVLAKELGCSPSAITLRLKKAGLGGYSVLKKAAGYASNHNHKVVSVELADLADVYDLTVDEHHNFGLEAGIFVSNSNWEVKPDTYYKTKRFHVLCGNADVASKILTPAEYEAMKGKNPEGTVIVEVPEDYRMTFELDLEKSIRDIAGIATVSVKPYIQRREKIKSAFELGAARGLKHPFSTEVYDMSKGGTFLWNEMVALRQERAPNRIVETKLRPILNPNATRHIHLDIGIKHDALGFCMSHVAGYKQVPRRTEDGREFLENAPIYVVDAMLRVIPPKGGEVILSEARHLIYDIIQHGYIVTNVSFDSYQSVDSIQQLSAKGIFAEVISVDRDALPYDTLKMALYEDRVIMYEYPQVQKELSMLQEDYQRGIRKIDHPPKGCFIGSTRIPLLDGRQPQIQDLEGEEVWVYSATPDGFIVPGKARGRKTKMTHAIVEVHLDYGATERCTPEHRWMLRDGSYVEAAKLQPGMELMPQHKVKAILPMRAQDPIPVYDLEVEQWSNFQLASGVIVHNSKDVSDALAGTIFTLSQQRVAQPLPIMRGSAYSAPTAWMEEQRQSAMAGNPNAGNSQPLPFFVGTQGMDPGGGGGWGGGNDGGGWSPFGQ